MKKAAFLGFGFSLLASLGCFKTQAIPIWHREHPNPLKQTQDLRERILFSYTENENQRKVILSEKQGTLGWKITQIQGLENSRAKSILQNRLPSLLEAIEQGQKIFIEDFGYGLRFYDEERNTIATYIQPIPL